MLMSQTCCADTGPAAAEADAGNIQGRARRQGVWPAGHGATPACSTHKRSSVVLLGVLHRGTPGTAQLCRRQRHAQCLGQRAERSGMQPTVSCTSIPHHAASHAATNHSVVVDNTLLLQFYPPSLVKQCYSNTPFNIPHHALSLLMQHLILP